MVAGASTVSLLLVFFLITTVAAVFGGIAQHPLQDDSMTFFRLASKSSSPLSYILCKLGMDPDFQLILHSSVQRDTRRLGIAMLTIAGDEEHGGKCVQQELRNYLQKSHLRMLVLPSLGCGH